MLVFALAAAVLAIVYGLALAKWILSQPKGDAKMQEIAAAIQEGAKAYLTRQTKTLGIVAAVLFVVLGLALNWTSALGFLVGAVLSALAGFIGMTISVTANVAPRLMHKMCVAAMSDDLPLAREINYRLLDLHSKLFVEANPIPVKWALAEMGRIDDGIRLPLTPLSAQYHDTIRAALTEAGCL